MIWLLLVVAAILMWSATSLLYKAGVHDGKEEHICLKYSVCVEIVFFAISLVYLIIREEPFSIFESAVRYWPMTVFGIVYAIVNTISYKGYVYNEATVESPVEGISGGTSVILLILAYLALGRADSITELLTPLRTAGILVILVCVILLSVVRNRANREKSQDQKPKWMIRGLGGKNCFLFNLSTEPAEIIDTQRKVEALLKEHNADQQTVGYAMLLIEEMYTIIRQKNDNKAVLAECTVILHPDGVQIISKDDGVSFDMTDDDVITTSLAGYTLSAFLEQKDYGNRHLTAMSFNRSSLFVKFPQD